MRGDQSSRVRATAEATRLASDDASLPALPALFPRPVLMLERTDREVLAGELDLETSPQLDGQLARIDETQVTRLLIDLSGVAFINSTCLRSMVRAHHFVKSKEPHPRAAAWHPSGQRLFELTGVDKRLIFERIGFYCSRPAPRHVLVADRAAGVPGGLSEYSG